VWHDNALCNRGSLRYSDGLMNKKSMQTQFSARATTLAESFQSTLKRVPVGVHGYAADMTSPDGPSTGGGVQAMQHVRLVPPNASLPTLLVGHANQRDGTAELRTYEHVDALCRERFRQGAPFGPSDYATFLQSAQGFLAAWGLRVSLEALPVAKGKEMNSSLPPRRSTGMVVAVVIAVVLAAVLGGTVVWFVK
jgi:hypothetical protein